MAKKQKGGLGRGIDSIFNTEDISNDFHVGSSKNTSFNDKESLYTNKEDNIVIKGVRERVIQNPSASTNQQVEHSSNTKKEDEEHKDNRIEVDIDLIIPNADQPRNFFDEDELQELSDSIKNNGMINPITVREKDGKYEIIAGERRWQASKKAGLKKVPIIINNVSDDDVILLALIENIQRSDLNPIEEAYGYKRMMSQGNMTTNQIAQAVSKGRSTVANTLRLLNLPEKAQQLLFENKITAGHARAILSIDSEEGKLKLTDSIVEKNMSVREAEAFARLYSHRNNNNENKRKKLPKSYKTVARSLKETLNTDVKVKSTKGKNKIEISFKDESDLERIFNMIVKDTVSRETL